MTTPRSISEKPPPPRTAAQLVRRDVDLLGIYAGVLPTQITCWHTKGLLLGDGSLVRLERLDMISLHTFIRRGLSHPSIQRIRPDVIRRAQELPAACSQETDRRRRRF